VFLTAMAMVLPADRVSAQQVDADPYLWLEEVESPEALDWVRERNARTVEALSRSAVYRPVFERNVRILDWPDPIPRPSVRDEDAYLWLEEVESPEALDWVRERNARTVEALSRSEVYRPVFERTVRILDSRDRIPMPSIRGEHIYNFWQDANNERGIWRRTTW